MARALWKGLVTFGLVNIPIELHTAARDHTPQFRLLHRTDLSPISLERICQNDGKAVAWNDLVKGYEIEKGRFVTVTEEDFKAAALERSRSIGILAFVPETSIDDRYWDTPYVALPSSGAESTYALLAEALAKSGRVGIAKYVMRQRQHLAALVSFEERLLVITMRFPEDLLALPEAPRAKINPRELKLAEQLIDGMADDWEPSRYKDDYVAALMKVIEAKAEGKPSRRQMAKAPARTNVVDLMDRLRESLAATRKARTASAARPQTAARKAASPRKSARKTPARRGHAA
jgi:DNA end-binding protein Ku